jgi:alkylation response protein AidB-like acyl-CoA dehydrogenase
VDLTDTAADREFRAEVRSWLEDHLAGDFAGLRGLGGPGKDLEAHDERLEWDRHLARHGWTCLGWPPEHGGRGLSLSQQVVVHEEYALATAPARVNHLGEELLGPTLIAFGTPTQQQRFLPPIRAVEELWCQGYSEPNAGSDLANVQTRARLEADDRAQPRSLNADAQPTAWVIDGQKVWTSLAQFADWIFVLARTEPGSVRHHGLSFLLVPMKQPGVEVRGIEQLTGGAEFNEVFFTGARTAAELVVGAPGQGWRVAMGLLGFERGVSTLGQQVGFRRELDALIELARANGTFDDPIVRDRLARADVELEVIGLNALRTLSHDGDQGPQQASIAKLLWAGWHRTLGELAMLVRGTAGLTTSPDGELDEWQRLFLFSRADTIYAGSDEIQRNILAERVLGLPRERSEVRA